jgi:Zn-dependent peptidase ImmA (M78 family)
MAGLHSNRGAKRAREARAAAGLDRAAPLPCLLTIVEERFGLPVVIAALPEGVAGACRRDGDAALLWVNGGEVRPRQRFTLAHELGHAYIGHDGKLAVDSFETFSGATTNPNEIEANAFAGEFLVPRVAVERRFDRDPDLEDTVRLAAEYGVSAIAALFRLTSADVVSVKRAARLREEIDAQHHLDVYERLALPLLEDRLEALEELPYTSPALAGSALRAALDGAAPVASAAHAAGVAPGALGPALEMISAR